MLTICPRIITTPYWGNLIKYNCVLGVIPTICDSFTITESVTVSVICSECTFIWSIISRISFRSIIKRTLGWLCTPRFRLGSLSPHLLVGNDFNNVFSIRYELPHHFQNFHRMPFFIRICRIVCYPLISSSKMSLFWMVDWFIIFSIDSHPFSPFQRMKFSIIAY